MAKHTPGPEEAIGTVIGPITVCGRLYYDGREQGPMLHAETDFELARVAEMAVKEFKSKYLRCYPGTGKWELRT